MEQADADQSVAWSAGKRRRLPLMFIFGCQQRDNVIQRIGDMIGGKAAEEEMKCPYFIGT
jgi:hypothetical protein